MHSSGPWSSKRPRLVRIGAAASSRSVIYVFAWQLLGLGSSSREDDRPAAAEIEPSPWHRATDADQSPRMACATSELQVGTARSGDGVHVVVTRLRAESLEVVAYISRSGYVRGRASVSIAPEATRVLDLLGYEEALLDLGSGREIRIQAVDGTVSASGLAC